MDRGDPLAAEGSSQRSCRDPPVERAPSAGDPGHPAADRLQFDILSQESMSLLVSALRRTSKITAVDQPNHRALPPASDSWKGSPP